jgi:hypothetical protein
MTDEDRHAADKLVAKIAVCHAISTVYQKMVEGLPSASVTELGIAKILNEMRAELFTTADEEVAMKTAVVTINPKLTLMLTVRDDADFDATLEVLREQTGEVALAALDRGRDDIFQISFLPGAIEDKHSLLMLLDPGSKQGCSCPPGAHWPSGRDS